MDPSTAVQGAHWSRTRQEEGARRGATAGVQLGDVVAQTRGSRAGGEKGAGSGSVLKVKPQDLLMDWMWDGREREEP